ncbi:NAD(P)-binding domain-containing protein [Geodermatophilus sp. DSM 44513]|uniref:ornithine cyclodeaminase family protein n=1 Tax=Geodermatophilus sp. DSM 44513 TaxID=1528104 RepID=UPI00127A1C69|nr:NAD(P)-binding domain-containing protein [Geodermatophilus sp. DSM 44513]WNV77086.1 NAD(P)-binding domain-containing protein [Geodermatophilus sp. DSM 44513]
MTLFLDGEDIRALATDEVCRAAARSALDAETAGRTKLPPRTDLPSDTGFIRTMPAVLDDVMGLKIMTLVRGVGNRYLVLLYGVEQGDLLGILDADELTRLRTATYTAVAADLMVSTPPTRLALLGSGFEAEGHLRALARSWPLESVAVFSPSPQRRAAFADRMAAEIAVPVTAHVDVADAVADAQVVVLATKATEPVLDGAVLPHGITVLSIGSTRPDLRELDVHTLRRSGTVVVDDPAQVLAESGDVIAACTDGALDPSRLVPVSAVARDPGLLRREPDRDLLTFKSVGTALQDLALARHVLVAARCSDRGRDLGELARLKPPAARALVPGGAR